MSMHNVIAELGNKAGGKFAATTGYSIPLVWIPDKSKYALRIGKDPSALTADSLFYIRTDGSTSAQVLYAAYGTSTTYVAVDIANLVTLATNVSVLTNLATFITALGGTAFYAGTTANKPADAATGYPKGALYFATDGTGLDDTVYLNIGTSGSANFDPFKGTS